MATVDAASDDNSKSIVNSFHVHPILLKKTWLCVEPETALKKNLHRLRERMHNETIVVTSPSPQVQEREVPSAQEEVTELNDDYCAKVDPHEPLRIHSHDHANSEITVLQNQDACLASLASAEDWQLLHIT